MRRRELVIMLAAAPFAAAGAETSLRLGVVSGVPAGSPGATAFRHRLAELGYREGDNLTIDQILLGQDMAPIAHAKIAVAVGAEAALQLILAAAPGIPVVIVAIDYDPVAGSYIDSFARPGRNITGVVLQQVELTGKRLEQFRIALPDRSGLVMFWDAISVNQVEPARQAAASLGLAVAAVELLDPPYDYDRALAQVPPDKRGALMVLSSPIFFRERAALAGFALRHRLPLISPFREVTEAGGLFSYGANIPAMHRRAAEYVDKIQRGAKPADLPVEQPTKFELVINLKTAKALGLAMPQLLLAQADEVIE